MPGGPRVPESERGEPIDSVLHDYSGLISPHGLYIFWGRSGNSVTASACGASVSRMITGIHIASTAAAEPT